jgi:peptide/nickel transport system permease protein
LNSLWKKLDSLGKWSARIIVLLALLALTAFLYIPDKSANANTMHIAIAAAKPGKKALVLVQHKSESNTISRFFVGDKQARSESIIIDYKVVGDTLFYQEKANSPWQFMVLEEGQSAEDFIEQKTFLLGTDNYGRDYLSRLVLGARVSLSVGFIAVFISLIIGIPLGAIAGFYRGWADKLIMWLINVIWSIPTLLMVIALTFVLGKGFWQVFVAVGLTMWVEVARVVRGQVLSIREKEFVDAARVLGFSNMRILFRHVLPNALSPVIVISAANFASAILIESGLSFLGIGAQPPIPSWGGMIRDHYAYIIMGNPYLAILPGLAIMIAVLAFMTLGNSLRDALDVKLSTSKA